MRERPIARVMTLTPRLWGPTCALRTMLGMARVKGQLMVYYIAVRGTAHEMANHPIELACGIPLAGVEVLVSSRETPVCEAVVERKATKAMGQLEFGR